jgi:hypothetical protein
MDWTCDFEEEKGFSCGLRIALDPVLREAR